MHACKAGKVDVVKELLEAGADVEKRDIVSDSSVIYLLLVAPGLPAICPAQLYLCLNPALGFSPSSGP